MVRTVNKKYQVWLAGYYDDFNGARAIPDDKNSPGTDRNHANSHHGNPMNGEATLNPRYRWAQPDRDHTGGSEYAPDAQKLLKNDGIFEFISHDDTRQSNDEWEGRAQLQYPDGHVANRYRFGGSGTVGYQRFVNGYDTIGSYLVPTGTNDATFGRSAMNGYTSSLYQDSSGNQSNAGVTDTTGDFVQRAHLAGVWMGEQLLETASDTPNTLFAEVTSPAKKPFLVIQSSRWDKDDEIHKPALIYDGPLNTRLDGDTFTTRVAVRTMTGKGGVDWNKVNLWIEVGFAKPTTALTDTGYTGTAAITQSIPLNYTAGGITGGITYDTKGELYDSSGNKNTSYTNDDTWLDIDFVFDYTDATPNYDVYVNGTLKVSNVALNGSVTPADLYGFQMTVLNGESTDEEGYVSYLMVDRFGLVRYLTDDVTGDTDDAPITNLAMSRGVNGISSCTVEVSDIPDLHTDGVRGSVAANYNHNLKDLFVATSAIDWQLLIFGDTSARIDRPLWRGIVDNFNIKQKARDRVLTFQANDALSIMDRTVPLWEIGQESVNDNEAETNYWLYEAQGFKNTMNLGSRELKLLGNDVGFDIDSSHLETSTQRTQLGSGHPIQMYNNEDTLGPNDIEDYNEGLGILGFNEDASGNTEIHVSRSDHGLTHPVNVTITNSTNHNGTYASSSVSGSKIVVAGGTLAVTGETAKIIYMGKAWGPFYDYNLYTNVPPYKQVWGMIDSANPDSSNFPSGSVADLHFIFDADPGLKVGDNFYVNGRNIANSATTPSLYIGRHKVKQIETTKSYFNGPTNGNKIYWIKTHSPYRTSSISGGEWPSSTAYSSDSLAQSNSRVEWSKDTGIITNVTEFPNRVLHARWMRDLPQSLWFQYHYGKIGFDPQNSSPNAGLTNAMQKVYGGVTYTPSSTSFRVTPTTYAALPEYGIAEIYRYGNYLGKFVYQGKKDNGSSEYYLVGVKYMFDYVSNTISDKIKVQSISSDYKHIWLLWADMRNNGKANADGAERKSDFGLQYPISDNYNFDLFYANQRNADGNLDKFASLKNGDDISVWSIDSTSDPITGGAFSKPADYANPVSATLGESSGKLTITIDSGDMTTYFGSDVDYVHLVGSTDHDGMHTISSRNATVLTTETTHTASTYQVLSSAVVYPTTGSDTDDTEYQDWEDKGGAFLVIDTAPFFNLNTHINNGNTGRTVGQRTDLGDYVATNEGFPMLIDNYWREATPSYLTTGDRALEHPNADYLISDATFVTDLDDDGVFLDTSYKGLPVDDASIFNPNGGYGMVRAIVESTTNEVNYHPLYFSYDSILTSELGSFSVSSAGSAATYGGVTGTQEIVCNGETLHTDGVREGMVLERTKGGVVSYHSVLNMGEAADDTNYETTMVVTRSGWDNTCTFTVPIQLGKVFMTTLLTDDLDMSLQSNERYPAAIRDVFNALSTDDWNIYGLSSPPSAAKSVEVHPTFGSYAMLRLLMHMDGFIKSRNSGTFFESDKIRTLWNAAITDSWLPPTRLTAMYDINNVPNTSIMTTYNDTSSNDSYGSLVQTKGKTLASILNAMRQKSGFGDTNSLKTTFSYLIGRDGRLEFRPKFNSHLAFTRTNMKISNFNSQLTAQITNVRVYYNGGSSFVDYPKPGLSDTTRWKILEMPDVRNSVEAQQIAKQEYNKSQNTPMELTIEPILMANVDHKMIERGRYGYIADPYIALKGLNANAAAEYKYITNWTRLGSGGVLFPGMVNALDGNQATTTDIYARYGNSSIDTSSSSITYDNNYTWYGANSISYAVQIVHISHNVPIVSTTSGEPMRMWVDLKSTQESDATIDTAEFTISLADYSFTDDRDKTATQEGLTEVDVKHSGFYEINIPGSYTTGGKIIISFNAEYCRALLRHRCGDPSSADILARKATNTNTIFPIGKREYTFDGGTMDGRAEWYAPRVQICNDMTYHPATIVSVTDPGIGLNTATDMVVKNIRWNVRAGQTDSVSLQLERDESIRQGNLITRLYGANTGGLVNSTPPSGMGAERKLPYPPGQPATPPSNPANTDLTPDLPVGGSLDPNEVGFGQTEFTINQQSSASFGRSVGGRMDMRDLGNSTLSILGMRNEGTMITAMRGIEGSDVSIIPTGGSAALTADGYVFGGKGKRYTGDSFAGNLTSQSIGLETQFTTPEDVVNDNIAISAKVSCGAGALGAVAVLETTATIVQTNTSVSHTVKISTNTSRQSVDLLPLTKLQGLSNPKNRVEIKIVRKPGTGSDTADTSSVILHNLDVRMDRASIPGRTNSTQFSTFS